MSSEIEEFQEAIDAEDNEKLAEMSFSGIPIASMRAQVWKTLFGFEAIKNSNFCYAF
jgi:hypothetical protein